MSEPPDRPASQSTQGGHHAPPISSLAEPESFPRPTPSPNTTGQEPLSTPQLPRSRAQTADGLRFSGASATSTRDLTAATLPAPPLQTTGQLSLAEEQALLDAAVEDDAADAVLQEELAVLEQRASVAIGMVMQTAPGRLIDDSDRVLSLVLLRTGLSEAQAAAQISTLPDDPAAKQLMINQLVAMASAQHTTPAPTPLPPPPSTAMPTASLPSFPDFAIPPRSATAGGGEPAANYTQGGTSLHGYDTLFGFEQAPFPPDARQFATLPPFDTSGRPTASEGPPPPFEFTATAAGAAPHGLDQHGPPPDASRPTASADESLPPPTAPPPPPAAAFAASAASASSPVPPQHNSSFAPPLTPAEFAAARALWAPLAAAHGAPPAPDSRVPLVSAADATAERAARAHAPVTPAVWAAALAAPVWMRDAVQRLVLAAPQLGTDPERMLHAVTTCGTPYVDMDQAATKAVQLAVSDRIPLDVAWAHTTATAASARIASAVGSTYGPPFSQLPPVPPSASAAAFLRAPAPAWALSPAALQAASGATLSNSDLIELIREASQMAASRGLQHCVNDAASAFCAGGGAGGTGASSASTAVSPLPTSPAPPSVPQPPTAATAPPSAPFTMPPSAAPSSAATYPGASPPAGVSPSSGITPLPSAQAVHDLLANVRAMCTRLHFDDAMYVTVPVWFDAQIAGDVSSVGVQPCSVIYIVLVFRFLQRELNLVSRGSRERANPCPSAVYVDILKPPDTITMHGAHRNLAYAESRGLLKERLVSGHLFHLSETGVWDVASNLLLADLVTASNLVPAFHEHEVTFRSLCVRKQGHDGINEMIDIYDHEYLLGSDAETRQAYNSTEWVPGFDPVQVLRTLLRLGRSLRKSDADILADWVAVIRQARASALHPNRPGDQEQVNKVVDAFAYRGVVHSSIQSLERQLTDHGSASKPLAPAPATRGGRAAGAAGAHVTEPVEVTEQLKADLNGNNGVEAAAAAMAALGINPRGNGSFRPPGGGAPFLSGPVQLDKVLASPDCPPRLKGLVRNPIANPNRPDGKYGTACAGCKKFEVQMVDEETHADFIRKYGPLRGNPECRRHIIVHTEPYCRCIRKEIQDHVKANPHLSWMEQPDPDYDRLFREALHARPAPAA